MVSRNSGKTHFVDGSDELNHSLEHLQVELTRIDVLIQHAVRRWQLSGQDAADTFRGLYVSDADATGLLQRPLGSNWGEASRMPKAEQLAVQEAKQQVLLQSQALQRGQTTRLQKLLDAFGLDEFDRDILLICMAPAFDLRYEKIYGYLQDDVTRKRPGVNLVLDLLCPPGFNRLLALSHFAFNAPLFKHHLLERFSEPGQNKSPLLSQSLLINETVAYWMLGRYEPPAELAPYLEPKSTFADSPLNEEPGEEYILSDEVLKQNPVFVFSGADQLAKEAAAQRLARAAKQSLLKIDLGILPTGEINLSQAFPLALRDARLTGSVLFVQGWDTSFQDDISTAGLFAEVISHPGIVILASHAAWRPSGLPDTRRIYWQDFPIPAYAERKVLWANYLEKANIGADVDVTRLASQFALTTEQIRDAVLLAVNHNHQHQERVSEEDFMAAARTTSSARLTSLAHKIPARYHWEDIVLPPDQISLLQEIVATVRGRATVLEEWGIGDKLASSRGVSILFAGPPGTGKTMSAQIIAAELGLDLYKIDLSTIVSKYIGETEKNLERIFREAESSNAILFFDEADALFGKRSEVRDSHDRYANVEISYLLQRMEAYDGVTILATNLRANLDEAFTRRLQFAVDFPFPEEADRLRIWQAIFPPRVPRANLDLEFLARRYKLSGGSIRNIILNAAYLANANGGVVTMEHLLHGTRRELQKMGRLIAEENPAHDS